MRRQWINFKKSKYKKWTSEQGIFYVPYGSIEDPRVASRKRSRDRYKQSKRKFLENYTLGDWRQAKRFRNI